MAGRWRGWPRPGGCGSCEGARGWGCRTQEFVQQPAAQMPRPARQSKISLRTSYFTSTSNIIRRKQPKMHAKKPIFRLPLPNRELPRRVIAPCLFRSHNPRGHETRGSVNGPAGLGRVPETRIPTQNRVQEISSSLLGLFQGSPGQSTSPRETRVPNCPVVRWRR